MQGSTVPKMMERTYSQNYWLYGGTSEVQVPVSQSRAPFDRFFFLLLDEPGTGKSRTLCGATGFFPRSLVVPHSVLTCSGMLWELMNLGLLQPGSVARFLEVQLAASLNPTVVYHSVISPAGVEDPASIHNLIRLLEFIHLFCLKNLQVYSLHRKLDVEVLVTSSNDGYQADGRLQAFCLQLTWAHSPIPPL